MRINVTVNGFYDWTVVPENTRVEEKDIKSRRVKQAFDGKWLMRVPRTNVSTHTDVHIGEDDLVAEIVVCKMKERRTLDRAQAAARILGRMMGDEAHPKWMEKFDVHDDGPVLPKELEGEDLPRPSPFELHMARHIEAGHIDSEDLPELTDAYMTPYSNAKLADHFRDFLGVGKK